MDSILAERMGTSETAPPGQQDVTEDIPQDDNNYSDDRSGMPDKIRDYFDSQDEEARRWLSKVWSDARAYEHKFNDINELKAWAASMG